jgi:hypothetical protein
MHSDSSCRGGTAAILPQRRSMRQPHVAQILTEEMALHDVPAAHLGRQRDDAVRQS